VSNDDDLVTAVNCADVALHYGDGEVFAQNTLSFRDTDGPMSLARLKSLADFMHDWHTTQVMPLLSNECVSSNSIAIDITTFPNHVKSSFPSVQVSGTGGAAIPFVCCMRIDFQTGSPWPYGVGKNFICGLPESVVTKSHISTTFANNVKAAYETLPTDIAPTHFEWVVLSRRFGGVNRASAIIQPVIAVTIPDLRIRTYRQRLPRFGT
jgi:hypothetical protein